MNKEVLGKISYGLYLLSAKSRGRDNGCIVNTVCQITENPDKVLVIVNKSNLTNDFIRESGKFNISVLSEKSKFSTYQHWGFQSGRDVDKTENISFQRSDNGLLYITDEANAYFSAEVVDSVDFPSHTMFIAQVTQAEVLSDDSSVTYDYYRKNIKSNGGNSAHKGYICMVCGYVYEGDPLPADFICPWCKHGADAFQKME